jgi:predicted RNA-binding protein with PIN domain
MYKDVEEIEQAKLERQKRGQDVDWDVILNATASTPLVIVDGYNIIHKYPRFKKWMKKGMLSKARNLFIHDMEELRALKGWRIEIVFDGYGRNVDGMLGDGAGSASTREKISKSDQEASKKVTDNGVRVVFSGAGMSADAYIEQRCYEAKKVTDGKLTGSLIIATDDNLIRSAGASAGAMSMSADRLIDELRALRKATMYRVEAAVAKANGHAIRPAKLMGTLMPTASTRGSIIIEDKRNRPKKKKKDEGEQARTLEDLKKGTTSLPSWAVVPPKDNTM